jgi:hypothetical protein
LPTLTANQRYVMQLYRDLLGREAEPAGLIDWSGRLDRGQLDRTEVALGIEASTEFRLRALQGVYMQFLQRSLDEFGGATWLRFLAGGGTLEQVAAQVIGSPEYYHQRGGSTDAGFLAVLYADVLGRPIDSDGAAVWGQALQTGASRTAVAQGVLSSLESNVREVQGLYRGLLRRDADETGLTTFVGAANAGVSNEVIAARIAGSDEYFLRASSVSPS